MVLHHHLLDGQLMTLITFQDGKAVFRNGKVGSEQECCCQQPCLCTDCPDELGFTITFYNTKNGNLTFTHPHTAPGGAQSSVVCDRYPFGTNISLGLTEDEEIPFGFSNVASASVSIACGSENSVDDGKWYVLVNGVIAVDGGTQVVYQYDGLVSVCNANGYAVIDTDLLAVQQCTDQATGNPIGECPVRVTVVIS